MINKRSRRVTGFTLIEILVVLTIIGLLLSFVAPMVLDRPNQARQLKVQNDLESIKAALSLYYIDQGSLPTESQGLDILTEGGSNGVYLAEKPIDPWGNGYQYRVRAGGQVIIFCLGPDGEVGGGDDIEIEVRR
ncbi:type II secretion system major pseudopilin GspG [Alphaproteobacteria bacterium LSUCC0684]